MQYRGVATLDTVGGAFFEAVTEPAGMMLSYDILGLMAYSTYNVSVRATNQYGVGNFSEELTVRTEEGGQFGIDDVLHHVLVSDSASHACNN